MENFTKYEKARIIGARALQISMGAPLLVDRGNEMNPIEIAKKEFNANVLPISIKREPPKRNISVVKELKEEVKGEEDKGKEE
jgi:DNA-directed RNA polymerase subunit K